MNHMHISSNGYSSAKQNLLKRWKAVPPKMPKQAEANRDGDLRILWKMKFCNNLQLRYYGEFSCSVWYQYTCKHTIKEKNTQKIS